MVTSLAVQSFQRKNPLLATIVGGLSAGVIDLAQALILFGARVPFGIATGLIGQPAAHAGGLAIYALGILLRFVIAASAATVYYVASRRLKFLIDHWLICGLLYGAVVDQVMTLIVLPLSALHVQGPNSFMTCFSASRFR